MENLEDEIRSKLYDFFSNKGLSEAGSAEIETWKLNADISLEIIKVFARDSLTIPESLKTLEGVNIKELFDFVRGNFSTEINQLKNYYQKKPN